MANQDTTATNVAQTEVSKLVESNVVAITHSPKVVSPLQVAKNGDAGVARQRHLSNTVAGLSDSRDQGTRIRLSAEGPRLEFFKNFESAGGRSDLSRLISILEDSASNSRATSTSSAYAAENKARLKWIREENLPLSETSSLLYLAARSEGIGSASLAKISAAFSMTNAGWSEIGERIASELIKAKRRSEVTTRKQPKQVDASVIQKIIGKLQAEIKSERDTLLVCLSYAALLRASEAADLLWNDLQQNGRLLEVKIRHAKNDQLGQGRSTFVECAEGSDLDCLLKRLKARNSVGKNRSEHVFMNINTGQKLSATAISTIVKRKLAEVGVDAAHHALRRGRANELQKKGFTTEEIQARGRWRSASGLRRYLTDAPEAQGLKQKPTIEVEELEDPEEEGEPPVLTREIPLPEIPELLL